MTSNSQVPTSLLPTSALHSVVLIALKYAVVILVQPEHCDGQAVLEALAGGTEHVAVHRPPSSSSRPTWTVDRGGNADGVGSRLHPSTTQVVNPHPRYRHLEGVPGVAPGRWKQRRNLPLRASPASIVLVQHQRVSLSPHMKRIISSSATTSSIQCTAGHWLTSYQSPNHVSGANCLSARQLCYIIIGIVIAIIGTRPKVFHGQIPGQS